MQEAKPNCTSDSDLNSLPGKGVSHVDSHPIGPCPSQPQAQPQWGGATYKMCLLSISTFYPEPRCSGAAQTQLTTQHPSLFSPDLKMLLFPEYDCRSFEEIHVMKSPILK